MQWTVKVKVQCMLSVKLHFQHVVLYLAFCACSIWSLCSAVSAAQHTLSHSLLHFHLLSSTAKIQLHKNFRNYDRLSCPHEIFSTWFINALETLCRLRSYTVTCCMCSQLLSRHQKKEWPRYTTMLVTAHANNLCTGVGRLIYAACILHTCLINPHLDMSVTLQVLHIAMVTVTLCSHVIPIFEHQRITFCIREIFRVSKFHGRIVRAKIKSPRKLIARVHFIQCELPCGSSRPSALGTGCKYLRREIVGSQLHRVYKITPRASGNKFHVFQIFAWLIFCGLATIMKLRESKAHTKISGTTV